VNLESTTLGEDEPVIFLSGACCVFAFPYPLDRVVIAAHLNDVCAYTLGLAHFAHHGVIAVAREPIDDCADDEVSAQVLGQAIEFVNVAL
jgi:uncharacterized membrane protein (Fun14 family)